MGGAATPPGVEAPPGLAVAIPGMPGKAPGLGIPRGRPPGLRADEIPLVGGGAINCASGSFEGGGAGAGALSFLAEMIGGGATGFANSAGSSPGNTQTPNFLS